MRIELKILHLTIWVYTSQLYPLPTPQEQEDSILINNYDSIK